MQALLNQLVIFILFILYFNFIDNLFLDTNGEYNYRRLGLI